MTKAELMVFPRKKQGHNNAHLSQARKFAVSTCWQKMVNTSLAKEDNVVIVYLKTQTTIVKDFKKPNQPRKLKHKILLDLSGITENIQVVKKLISRWSHKFKHQLRQPAKILFSLVMIVKQIALLW